MKRGPYRYAFAAMVATLLVACSGSVGIDAGDKPGATASTPQKTLDAALQADRDFAAMVKADGLQAAFRKYMHPTDSKFLQPGVVVEGAEAIAAGFARSPPDFTIAWEPDGGHGSASGDLAVTTGPYTISVGGQSIEKGRYVTVWGRDAAGDLKATMDLTVPAPITPPLTTPDPEGRPG